jgi:hypothetical protein
MRNTREELEKIDFCERKEGWQGMKKCIGFGEHTGKCDNRAINNPHWCDRCNAIRITKITLQWEQIARVFEDGVSPL